MGGRCRPAGRRGRGPARRHRRPVQPGRAASQLDDRVECPGAARDRPDHAGQRRAPGDADRVASADQAIEDRAGQSRDVRVAAERRRPSDRDRAQVQSEALLHGARELAVLGRDVAIFDADEAVSQGAIDEPRDAEPRDPEAGRDLDLAQLAIEEEPRDLGREVRRRGGDGRHASMLGRAHLRCNRSSVHALGQPAAADQLGASPRRFSSTSCRSWVTPVAKPASLRAR